MRGPPMLHLLHQHVDVGLGGIQRVAMRLDQTLHSDIHGLAVDVDPARRSGGQKSSAFIHGNDAGGVTTQHTTALLNEPDPAH